MALTNYIKDIIEIKKISLSYNISDSDFRKLYFESLAEIENDESTTRDKPKTKTKYSWRIIILLLIIVVILIGYLVSRLAYGFVMANIQELIYPGLRLLRKLSLPILIMFPSISELYDETCLVQNPLFRVSDMDCWPCSTVNTVYQLQDGKSIKNREFHGTPFLYKINQSVIDVDVLTRMYYDNKMMFDQDAPKVKVNDKHYTNADKIFGLLKTGNHDSIQRLQWRMNRMMPAQRVRKIFPRPDIIPRLGQSTERFVIVDFQSGAFKLPDTECNFVFVIQGKGEKHIELYPSNECIGHCKPVSVLLKQSYLLWYNWWYWRPVSLPAEINTTSIMHIGSYC